MRLSGSSRFAGRRHCCERKGGGTPFSGFSALHCYLMNRKRLPLPARRVPPRGSASGTTPTPFTSTQQSAPSHWEVCPWRNDPLCRFHLMWNGMRRNRLEKEGFPWRRSCACAWRSWRLDKRRCNSAVVAVVSGGVGTGDGHRQSWGSVTHQAILLAPRAPREYPRGPGPGAPLVGLQSLSPEADYIVSAPIRRPPRNRLRIVASCGLNVSFPGISSRSQHI
jgi:hypothetical protein